MNDKKTENLLGHVLISHDSGWYHAGEPGGGNYKDHNTIADKLIPAVQKNDFTEKEIQLLFFINPAKAFTTKIRKK